MKIAFLITDITGFGGIERVTQTVAQTFSIKGHDVTIISLFKRNENITYSISPSVRTDYITMSDYNLSNSIVSRTILLVKAALCLKEYLRNNQFDIIIAQALLPASLLWIIGRLRGVIVCEHFRYELYNSWGIAIRNHIYRKAMKIVTLTHKDRDKFQQAGIDAITIPNMNPFSIAENHSSGKRIIAIGRLHPQKGFDLLIPSMVKVFQQFPDWKLDIYGEGDERNHLTDMINTLHLSDHISLKGFSKDIRSEMLKSDLFVLSSRYEGLPMALLELMSSGVPIVSFDCPEGPADLLKNGAGLLVEPGNSTALSDAIIKVISNSDLRERFKKKGYENSRRYAPDNIYPMWNALFLDKFNVKA